MEFLKALFESGALTWEQFSAAVTEKGYKVADLATGNYVSKAKFDDEIGKRDTTITDLNTQISTRDGDLADLQTKLANAGTDNKTKVADLTAQLTKLQGDYGNVKNEYEGKLSKQAYEFAVKEFAGGKKFSSNAAKRDFINEMLNKNLTMEGDKIMGAEDFVTSYSAANEDAFVVETSPAPEPETPLPSFTIPNVPTPAPEENAFINAFNFAGVRPHENK